MVEKERGCTDVLIQIAAAKAALDSIAHIVAKDYAHACMDEISSEGGADKIESLMQILFKYL